MFIWVLGVFNGATQGAGLKHPGGLVHVGIILLSYVGLLILTHLWIKVMRSGSLFTSYCRSLASCKTCLCVSKSSKEMS